MKDEVEFLSLNLAENLKSNKSLEKLLEIYLSKSLTPIIGAEIEFYCYGYEDIANIEKYAVKKEKGRFQYEINIEPAEPIEALRKIYECFWILEANIEKYNIKLAPKPFKEDYGNALQLHINFLNEKEVNLFDDSNILSSCCDILCEKMLGSLSVFAPTAECYERFDKNFLAPTNVSKGFNNRTTALRIPPIGPKRIEYRVGAYPADPYQMIYVILNQLKEVVIDKKAPKKYEFIYGNAFDEQYELVVFPKNLWQS